MIQQNDQTTVAVIHRRTGDDSQCLDTIWAVLLENLWFLFNSSTIMSQWTWIAWSRFRDRIECMIQDDWIMTDYCNDPMSDDLFATKWWLIWSQYDNWRSAIRSKLEIRSLLKGFASDGTETKSDDEVMGTFSDYLNNGCHLHLSLSQGGSEAGLSIIWPLDKIHSDYRGLCLSDWDWEDMRGERAESGSATSGHLTPDIFHR